MTTNTVNQLSGWLENFVLEAVESRLNERIAEANPAYELACQLQDMGKRINRIRLHIFLQSALDSKIQGGAVRQGRRYSDRETHLGSSAPQGDVRVNPREGGG
jgi:hypothetical protein